MMIIDILVLEIQELLGRQQELLLSELQYWHGRSTLL
jgi:hypothetical protein